MSDHDSFMASLGGKAPKAKKTVSPEVLERLRLGREKRKANLLAQKASPAVPVPEAPVAMAPEAVPEAPEAMAPEGQGDEVCPTCGCHIKEGTIAERTIMEQRKSQLAQQLALEQSQKAQAMMTMVQQTQAVPKKA